MVGRVEVLAVDGIMEEAGDVITVGNKLGDEVVTVGDVVEKSEEVTLLIEGEDIVVEVKEG